MRRFWTLSIVFLLLLITLKRFNRFGVVSPAPVHAQSSDDPEFYDGILVEAYIEVDSNNYLYADALTEVEDDEDDDIDAVSVDLDADQDGDVFYSDSDDYDYPSAAVDTESSAPVQGGHKYGVYALGGVYYYDEEEEDDDFEYVGDAYASVYVASTAPQLSSLSPSTVVVGQSGTLTISGSHIIGTAEDNPTLNYGGSGVTFTSTGTPNAHQAQFSFTVDANAPVGTHDITLTTGDGTSNALSFTVGYPPAVVTGVTPNVWLAGNDYEVTVTGTGFGNSPSVSVVVPGAQAGGAYNSSSDGTSTHFHVHVDSSTPNETGTVTVAPGYAGSSFICGSCNGSPNGNGNVTVEAQAPLPQIMFNGQNVTGTNQDVSAGQQIALMVPAPNNLSVTKQMWSFSNQPDITGGYIANSSTADEAADPDLTTSAVTFYWVVPGADETVTYTYYLSNGTSATASVTFTVDGPTGNVLLNEFINATDAATVVLPTDDPTNFKDYTRIAMRNSPVGAYYGVFFNMVNATPPAHNAGVYTYVQILNSTAYPRIGPAGLVPGPVGAKNQLDGGYPYPTKIDPTAPKPNATTSDAPAVYIANNYGESGETFDATMYALWDPALPSGCTPAHVDTSTIPRYTYVASTCTSIPIPLSSAEWGWSNCVINHGVEGAEDWQVKCGPGKRFDSKVTGYPVWGSCHQSRFGSCD